LPHKVDIYQERPATEALVDGSVWVERTPTPKIVMYADETFYSVELTEEV
jgi:hypothetical protein